MKIKIFLLCSMAAFSGNTRAAQEPVLERTVTITNQLESTIYIHPENISAGEVPIGTHSKDPFILEVGKSKSFSVKWPVNDSTCTLYYSQVKTLDSANIRVYPWIKEEIIFLESENKIVVTAPGECIKGDE